MKLTDEQRSRIADSMLAELDVTYKADTMTKCLAAGMRELAEIYANKMTPETSELGDVVYGLMKAVIDLEAK